MKSFRDSYDISVLNKCLPHRLLHEAVPAWYFRGGKLPPSKGTLEIFQINCGIGYRRSRRIIVDGVASRSRRKIQQ